jgi:hypothetical protein
MSGGVDSNTLISVAKRVFGYDVHGFTIINTDRRYEEKDLVEWHGGHMSPTWCAIPICLIRTFSAAIRIFVITSISTPRNFQKR